MQFDQLSPTQIEEKSFQILSERLGQRTFEPGTEAVIKRCIHTTADFEYADNLYFTPKVTEIIKAALLKGADIVTDTKMAAAGINKKKLAELGGEVHCFIDDPWVAEEALKRGATRSSVAVEKVSELKKPVIMVVGNAPTALISLHKLMANKKIQPQAIIAAPVGFVNVVESKQLIIDCGWPAIVAKGNKGGSNVAAAIVNACLYQVR